MFLAKDLKKLKKTNTTKDNITVFKTPYFALGNKGGGGDGKMVIFMGHDFHNLSPDLNKNDFIDIENKCLDYVRKECAGYDLYYKPHPAETNEADYLNLASFKFIEDTSISEFFLMKNMDKIQYIFSPFSWISASAYAMGFNSFVFLPLYKTVMSEDQVGSYEDYFKEMPPQFFINSLDQKLTENKIVPPKDESFEKEIKNAISSKSGAVWFIIADPGLLPIVIAMTRLIKNADSNRNTNLIICRHNRWDKMDIKEITPYFDEINIFKRTFYSLRPRKIFDAVMLAFSARKLPISGEDIIFGFAHSGFLENCLVSYNKRAMTISCQLKLNPDWMYGISRSEILSDDKFYQIGASIFYNRILEPMLGLNRTLYLKYGDGTVFNISRYEKPLNDVYDKVYLFENGKY